MLGAKNAQIARLMILLTTKGSGRDMRGLGKVYLFLANFSCSAHSHRFVTRLRY